MSLLARLGFELWYLRRPPWDTGISPPELLQFIESHPRGRAIDLGCGTGTNALTLRRAGWKVTAVDFSGRAIGMARAKAQRAGLAIEFVRSDVASLQLPGQTFELALDIGCFHSLPDRQRYIDHLTRLLTPGGYWLMYGFHKRDPRAPGPGLHETDLAVAGEQLHLIWRKDGTDRKERPSSWFLFQNRVRP